MFELNRKPPQDKSDSEQDATRRFFEEASSLSRGESGRSTKRPVQEIAFNSNAELFPATTEPQVKPRARFTSGWEGTGWEEVVRPPYVTIPYRRYKIDENETGWRGWLISGEEYTGEFKVLFVGSSNLYMPLPSGSEIKTLDKGKFEITTPDGTVITGESDGKYHHQLRKTHKDGKVETINETGRRTTIQDGITTSEERYSDGNWIRTTVELPNGRKTITETTKTSWQDQTIKRTELDEHGKEVSRTEVGQIRKPYIGNNLQRIGELVIEEDKIHKTTRIYDVDSNGKPIDDSNSSGELAEKKRQLLKKLQADFKGISFSTNAEGEERISFNGRSYPHRAPTYRELLEIDAALRLTYPSSLKADRTSIDFVFLNTRESEIKNQFGLAIYARQDRDLITNEQKVYVYGDATRGLAVESEIQPVGDYHLPVRSFRRLIMHELIHNADRQRDPANAKKYYTLEREVADAYGFQEIQTASGRDWAVKTSKGLYVQTKEGWKNINQASPTLTADQLRAIALVPMPTTYSYHHPAEANAEIGSFYYFSPESRKKLKQDFPKLYAIFESQDRKLIDFWYPGGTHVRDKDGYLRPK